MNNELTNEMTKEIEIFYKLSQPKDEFISNFVKFKGMIGLCQELNNKEIEKELLKIINDNTISNKRKREIFSNCKEKLRLFCEEMIEVKNG